MAQRAKSKSAAKETRLELTVIVYGSAAGDPTDDSRFAGADQRRAEIEFSPRVPDNKVGKPNEIAMWANNLVQGLGTDVKHSQKWHCEFCGTS
ncbi:hypothetical protein EIP86_000326 [Pleurotus ostreatoroseus]|nr:hypothetical protein EIP86_000326 [Pleurotus ostreatoroseus]